MKPKSPITKLTIDRKRWLRGTGSGLLLDRSNNKMCCLGFYSIACGLPKKLITNHGCPADIEMIYDMPLPEPMQWLRSMDFGRVKSSQLADKLMRANDKISLDPEVREERITRYFAKKGIEVEFIN